MFKNYLLTALRNLLNNKLYTAINVGGLALGLAACILILLFVRDELSFDDWIPNAEQIFKIELTIPIVGRDTLKMGQVPPAIPPAMEAYFPDQIEDTTRVFQSDSILGLFGLAAYSAEQRTLEIGIRKVLGARTYNILSLIGSQLLKSVIWANVIAWPTVYFVMRDWLNNYQYRIDIDPFIFIACGVIAALLALFTVGWQVMKVARRNPIHALHYE